MAHDTDPANLITSLNPAFQASRTNATRYRLDPANATGKPHDATRSPIRHYIQRHTLTTTGMAHDMTGRQAGRHGGKESLFIWEAGRPAPPSPMMPNSRSSKCGNPSP